MLQPFTHLLPRLSQLLRMPILQLRLRQHLLTPGLLPSLIILDPALNLLGVNRHIHELYAAQIGRLVFPEAARDEGARGVAAGEEVVRTAGAVGLGGGGHVIDGAVEGEVDGLLRVRAVVGSELIVSEADAAVLFDI